MERSRPDMTHNVERRAAEAGAGHVPAGPAELREPFRRIRVDGGRSPSPVKPADSGLTRRERKVKNMLLRELGKRKGLTTLSYSEIQNLDKSLNVKWIDEQLASMRKMYKATPWFWPAYGAVMSFNVYNVFADGLASGSAFATGFGIVFGVALLAVSVGAPIFHRSALRRKIFIYEALRELAGADEVGVTLSQAVEDADALIARIVDMELAAEADKPAKSIGRVRVR